MTLARFVLAVVSTLAVEAAFYTIWRWVLPESDINVPLWALVTVMVGWAIFAVVDFWFVTHVLRRKALVGLPDMKGTQGKVISPLHPEGLVRIGGELWGAKSLDGAIEVGEKVVVVGQDGLQLIVRRTAGQP
jgi:membrane-bound ClpP family serine protease